MSEYVHGEVDPAFREVREVFEADFAGGQNVGASVAVFVDGRAVADLWGGLADARTQRQWLHDTPAITFSCTKALTATAALAIAHETGTDLNAPVTTWWPEFAAAGKDATTLADLLTHSAGLPVLEQPATVADAADPAAMAALLAAQRPVWEPGTEHGYHALTFGWLVGEFVRRHTNSTVGEFVRRRFGADLWIGAPPEVIARAARMGFPPPTERAWLDTSAAVLDLARAYQDPDSLLMRGSTNPMASANKPEVLAGGWPAAGLVTTARALAAFYRDLVTGTLLPAPVLREAVREQVRGPDAVLVQESAFGLGYMLPAQNFVLPHAARATAFGHPGAGGALGLGDLTHRVAIAFVPNLRRDWLSGDRRAYNLVRAVYDAL